jgi:hypothetical protein
MLHFSEDFVGGIFGLGRTCGASARFECESTAELETDWPKVLAETAQWRARRAEKATALNVFIDAPPSWQWDAIAFVKARLILPSMSLAPELRGLFLRVYVPSPEMQTYLYVELFPETHHS